MHVEEGDARGGRIRKLPSLSLYWRPTSWPLLVEGLRNGLLATPPVQRFRTFSDGDTLDVPGRPRAVAVPGHTAGSSALHLSDRGVLFSGDALVTLDPYTRAKGPRLMLPGVNKDHGEARASLPRLAPLEAEVLLPGHGEPWRGTPAAAVEEALRR